MNPTQAQTKPTFDATAVRASITEIAPPEQGFFSKKLIYKGIPIKSPAEVSDEALVEAYRRLDMILVNLSAITQKLSRAGAELQIIGKSQVTSDLPDYRHLKGKKIPEYGGLTVDERTRGLGGLHTSCGEENLLNLPNDHYKGRDICVHEFAHNIQDTGMSDEMRAKFRQQFQKSTEQGLWKGAYAASNEHEFFAELTMWYFGTHGDLNMQGEKPENGREGLRHYDPAAYRLFDEFYSGRLETSPLPATQN